MFGGGDIHKVTSSSRIASILLFPGQLLNFIVPKNCAALYKFVLHEYFFQNGFVLMTSFSQRTAVYYSTIGNSLTYIYTVHPARVTEISLVD